MDFSEQSRILTSFVTLQILCLAPPSALVNLSVGLNVKVPGLATHITGNASYERFS